MKTIILHHSVDWSHCDPAGIIFYPEFYIWFDQATEHLFDANGLSYENLREKYNVVGLPLVESGAKYKAPCKHGEKVEIRSFVEDWAGKTFLVRHRIYHKNGTEAMEGFERRAWAVFNPSSGIGMRAEVVPEEVIQLFVD